MSVSAAEAEGLRLRSMFPVDGTALKQQSARDLEDSGYQSWLAAIFPDQFDSAFIDVHTDFWDWGWKFLIALRDKKTLPKDANAFLALWSRNFGKSMHSEVFTAAAVCVVGSGIFLYVSGTQDLANTHLENIGELLISNGVKTYYPEHSRPKKSVITGANKAWSQSKLATEGGVILWAIGLNVGVRGIRKGKDRVKGFILDDIDSYDDSPQIALNKANTLGSSVLPTSDTEFFVIGAQNLITEHSVFNRIYTKADMMLAHRIAAPPVPAFDNLDTKFIDGRDMIVSGESRWPSRVTYDVAQRFIDTYGLIRFKAEFLHDFSQGKQGLCFDNYDDAVHVITKSEFAKIFGTREIPSRWWKYHVHDHARTKTAYHANVQLDIAVSSMNERLPGCFFLCNPQSFPAQTEADEVAIRFLRSVSPTVKVNGQERSWDELIESSMKRTNMEAYQSDLTKLMRARRATLAKIIPPIVGPMLAAKNYKGFRMSHEQINAAGKVYKEAFGIPYQPMNPGKDGGIELFNHYLKVDYLGDHPFGANANRPDGKGFSRVFIIVEDSDLAYTTDVAPDRLHDAQLLRYQFKHWRYTTPVLNDKGEKEFGPMKMNDDFGNSIMQAFVDNQPQAAPLSKGEQIHEHLPVAMQELDTDEELRKENPEKWAKMKIAQQIKLKGLQKSMGQPKTRNTLSKLRAFQRGR